MKLRFSPFKFNNNWITRNTYMINVREIKNRQSRETDKIGPITYKIIRIKKSYVERVNMYKYD